MAYIFLSHSHADKPFARKLAADLRANGHSVWIDEAEIDIGDSLVSKIRDGLDRVDYVCAILSHNSINSVWVQKELDIATNREIDERRVIVLPVLVSDVELPGFLRGKFYGDFRDESRYSEVFAALLRAVKGSKQREKSTKSEVETLNAVLLHAQEQAKKSAHAAKRAERAAFLAKSEPLKAAIQKANAKFPEHAPINNTYAFEVSGNPVSLDYLLWAIQKAMFKGTHPLDMLISIDNKWPEVENMLEAYKEMLDSQE